MSPSPSDVGIIYPRLSRRISFFQPAYNELDEENHVLSDNRRPREGIPRLSLGSIVGSPRENEPPGRLTHPPHSNPRLTEPVITRALQRTSAVAHIRRQGDTEPVNGNGNVQIVTSAGLSLKSHSAANVVGLTVLTKLVSIG